MGTAGYIMAIDQASNAAGVSLWYRSNLIATTELLSESRSDKYSRRLQHIVPQLTAFLDKNLPRGQNVEQVIFEGMKARLVLVTVGAFLTCPRIDARLHAQASFVESTSWKKWAQRRGASGPLKDIKGVKALRETGFPVDDYAITSDDVADSIMIYLTWQERHGGFFTTV